MQLLARHFDQQFQKNPQKHTYADELMVKIQRLRECFLGTTLPFPTVKITAVWNDLPNITVNNLALSAKTEPAFIRAPPPTPTRLAFNTDGPTSSDPSCNDGHNEDDWLLVNDATRIKPDVVIPPPPGGSATAENDDMSGCSYPVQPLDRQVGEEDSLQSTYSSPLSSDQESLSSSVAGSPTPVGFHNMVNQWLLDYRARGTAAFIDSLIAFGVISAGTALLASRIARAMVMTVTKTSYTEGQNLHNAVRFSSLEAFRKYWGSDGEWTEVSSAQANTAPPAPYGINIGSLIGSLFDEKISAAKDILACLSLLLEGEKRFDRLCAMHALLVQANDKMCKNRNLPALMRFRDGITSINAESGEYLWATGPRSKMIIADILVTIERWLVSQAARREQSRVSAWTGNRIVRNSAVGPRLRNLNSGPAPAGL